MAVIEVFAGNLLNLSQSGIAKERADSFLGMLSSAEAVLIPNPFEPKVKQTLNLVQSVSVQKVLHLNAGNFLGLGHSSGRCFRLDVYDLFFPYHSLKITPYGNIGNTFQLQQSAIGQATKGARNTLIFGQTVGLQHLHSENLISFLNLISKAQAYLEKPSFIGVPLTPVAPSNNVTFSYGGLSITLRAPEFGNKDKIQPTRISRSSRGGDLIIYRDPAWPTTEIFNLSFTLVTKTQKERLLNFLDKSLGQIVTYTDYEGRVWNGIITTPQMEISQDLPDGPCFNGYACSLEFQVSL